MLRKCVTAYGQKMAALRERRMDAIFPERKERRERIEVIGAILRRTFPQNLNGDCNA